MANVLVKCPFYCRIILIITSNNFKILGSMTQDSIFLTAGLWAR